MESADYNKLPINDRANILWARGRFLENWYDYGKYKIGLYFLDSYYVEVYYAHADNKLVDIRAWEKMPAVGRPIIGLSAN